MSATFSSGTHINFKNVVSFPHGKPLYETEEGRLQLSLYSMRSLLGAITDKVQKEIDNKTTDMK